MNLTLRMSKAQLVLFFLIIVSLLITALFVVHAAMPSLWHTVADTPNIIFGHP